MPHGDQVARCPESIVTGLQEGNGVSGQSRQDSLRLDATFSTIITEAAEGRVLEEQLPLDLRTGGELVNALPVIGTGVSVPSRSRGASGPAASAFSLAEEDGLSLDVRGGLFLVLGPAVVGRLIEDTPFLDSEWVDPATSESLPDNTKAGDRGRDRAGHLDCVGPGTSLTLSEPQHKGQRGVTEDLLGVLIRVAIDDGFAKVSVPPGPPGFVVAGVNQNGIGDPMGEFK